MDIQPVFLTLRGQLVNPGLDHDRVSVGVFLIRIVNGFDQLKTQPLKKS